MKHSHRKKRIKNLCWICLTETIPEDDKFIHPCKCTGSTKWVHHNCLVTWIKTSDKIDCPQCKYLYDFTMTCNSSLLEYIDKNSITVSTVVGCSLILFLFVVSYNINIIPIPNINNVNHTINFLLAIILGIFAILSYFDLFDEEDINISSSGDAIILYFMIVNNIVKKFVRRNISYIYDIKNYGINL